MSIPYENKKKPIGSSIPSNTGRPSSMEDFGFDKQTQPVDAGMMAGLTQEGTGNVQAGKEDSKLSVKPVPKTWDVR